MGFDRVSNGERNPSVEEMVDEAAAVLEAVADDSWILWGAQVLPNVVARVKDEGSEQFLKQWSRYLLRMWKRMRTKISLIRRRVARRS